MFCLIITMHSQDLLVVNTAPKPVVAVAAMGVKAAALTQPVVAVAADTVEMAVPAKPVAAVAADTVEMAALRLAKEAAEEAVCLAQVVIPVILILRIRMEIMVCAAAVAAVSAVITLQIALTEETAGTVL